MDTGNDRVEKFTASGTFVAAYGGEGSGAGQFKEPSGVAVSQSTGEVFVSDAKNNRIDVLNSAGGFVEAVGWGVSDGKAGLEVCKTACEAGLAGSGNGELSGPAGVTLDSKGDLWVVDAGNDRVQELNGKGEYVSQFGGKGSGNGQLLEPSGVAISEGSLYVVDRGNDRVQQFSKSGVYMGQFGERGAGAGQLDSPFGIAANPTTGVLYVCDDGNERMEEFSPAGKFLTQWQTWAASHEQIHPIGVAVNQTGDLYVIDHVADVVGEWAPPEAGGAHLSFATMFGSKGSGNGQLSEPGGVALDGKGNVWVSDYANNRVQEFSGKGAFLAAYGKEGTGEVQFKKPTRLAVNKSTGNVYVTDMANNRVEEISSAGAYVASFGTSGTGALKEPIGDAIDSSGNVWVADRGNNRIVEFSSTGAYIAAYGKEGTGELQFKAPDGIAFSGENVYVTDSANHRVQEISNKGVYVREIGFEGSGSGEFFTPEGIAADAAGNLYVSDINANHVQELSPTGAFKATYGSQGTSEGHFEHPIGLAVDPAGDMYVVDNGNSRIQLWDNNKQAVHDSKVIDYTVAANSEHKECGEHPEWANLTCRTEPVAQPSDAKEGMPEQPVTKVELYNVYGQPETTVETSGAATKTTSVSYDEAGRVLSSQTASSVGSALPAVLEKYSSETGALVETYTEGTEGRKATSSVYNTLGQLQSYTDAAGTTSTYSYDSYDRLAEANDGKGTQRYSYNEATGQISELTDSQAGSFKAAYDVEGNVLSETYPNGMTVSYGVNSAGEEISLSYVKTAHCSEHCMWFSDAATPTIHGQWASQASTLASESYSYDAAGRLTQVQETPAETGCTTRAYAYDEETNRRSLTTTAAGSKGECGAGASTIERHLYDEANRLTDEGVSYDAFGDITTLPAADAGASKLESHFYADGQLAEQTQNGETIGYKLDPEGRTRQITDTGTINASIINHYAGSEETPAWTEEPTSGHWTRNITGIGGGLAAIDENGETTLQIEDMQGNIVGTASLSETATTLLSSERSSEYGVPTTSKPKRYSFQGANRLPTELSSGVIAMGARSYIPQIGRFLQTDPQPGGSANQYAYTHGNPINETDPTGELTYGISEGGLAEAEATSEQIAAEATAKEEAKKHEAEEHARRAAQQGESPETGGAAGLMFELQGSITYGGFKGCAVCRRTRERAEREKRHRKEEEGLLEWAAKEGSKWVKRAFKEVMNRFKVADPYKYEGTLACKTGGYALALAGAVAPEGWFVRVSLLGAGAATTRAC